MDTVSPFGSFVRVFHEYEGLKSFLKRFGM
jgi:hypothetical protein